MKFAKPVNLIANIGVFTLTLGFLVLAIIKVQSTSTNSSEIYLMIAFCFIAAVNSLYRIFIYAQPRPAESKIQ